MNNKNIKPANGQACLPVRQANLIITPRDIEIFSALTKYHLTGRMIFDLSQTFAEPFRSITNTRARLNQLYLAGYLKRDLRFEKGKRNNESYYFLTPKCAACLADLEGIEKKNTVFQPRSIARQAHSFLISQVMVKMETDLYMMKGICQMVGFIRENHFEVKGNDKKAIRPDGSIFVNLNGQNFLLFLEADRSTEVVNSAKPEKRTFERKMQIYSEFKNHFWQNEIIHRFEGIKGYRVLIVCKSVQRLRNLLNLAKAMNKSSMFWFTTVEWFLDDNRNCLFDRIWTLPNGQFYPLF